jgi:hypothetical protein
MAVHEHRIDRNDPDFRWSSEEVINLDNLEINGPISPDIDYRYEIFVDNAKGNFILQARSLLSENSPVGGLRVKQIVKNDNLTTKEGVTGT